MKDFRFFAKAGDKPLIISANSAEEAKQIFNQTMMKAGIRANADQFPMQEGSRQDIAKRESETMGERTKQAQKEVQQQEDSERGFGENLLRGAVRMFSPNQAESYEETGEGNMLSGALDALMLPLSALGMGQAPKAVTTATKAGAPAIKRIANSAMNVAKNSMNKAQVGEGLANVLGDVAQQQQVQGDLNPFRTAFGVGANFAPALASGAGQSLKNTGKAVAENKILPSKASMNSPNPPDAERALEKGMFRGAGKYSALDKYEKMFEPIYARLNAIKDGGATVDLEVAKASAMKNIDDMQELPEKVKDLAKNKLNDFFDAELSAYKKRVPEKSHREAVPNDAFYKSRDNAERIVDIANREADVAIETDRRAKKGKFTKAKKEYEKWKEDLITSGISPRNAEQITGAYPEMELPISKSDMDLPKLGEFSFNQLNPWTTTKVVEREAFDSFNAPIGDALAKKSYMQNKAYRNAMQNELGGEPMSASFALGLLDAIEQSSPEARALLSELAPDFAMYKALQNRQAIKGSNSPISMKGLLGMAVNPVLGGAIALGDSPAGAQAIYDAGKAMQSPFAKVLGFNPSFGTTQLFKDENE